MDTTQYRAPIWPNGKRFAFSIFDDTDDSSVDNVREVYALLKDLGFRTTKSVWPISAPGDPGMCELTCADPRYLAWVQSLQRDGFEVAFHNATSQSSLRHQTETSLELFRSYFGGYPRNMTNHEQNAEGIYWGPNRLSGINRQLYQVVRRKHNRRYRGHIKEDPYFWGDHCQDKIQYVRNFTFANINTLKCCPFMPYHDPERPYVRYWYASSEASDVHTFLRTVSEKHQDDLQAQGGACILYVHFAYGFQEGRAVHSRFSRLLRGLASKSGWFVPASTLLDHLLVQKADANVTPIQRARLERRWLLHKILTGTT